MILHFLVSNSHIDGCYQNSTICNCDIDEITSESVTLSDGGYLMDKDTLPLMEIHIGSRSGDIFTLGPLECYGALSENQGT